MAYVPDPTDPTQPVGSVLEGTAAAEFRALKLWLQSHSVSPSSFVAAQNYILGGDFDTNPFQRGTTFAAVADGTITADRWAFAGSHVAGSAVTVSQELDAPTITDCGIFTQHCLALSVTTPLTPVNVNSLCGLVTPIEGTQFRPIAQQNITLSFWHKHDIAGVYSVFATNEGHDQWYVGTYTQTTPTTWEKAIVTLLASPSGGTWNYGLNVGLSVGFVAAAGANFYSTAGAWASGGPFYCTAAQPNILATAGNNFKIALVQLELGNTSSPFIYENHIDTLAQCQRYYEFNSGDGVLFSADVTSASTYISGSQFKVTKVQNPTMVVTSTSGTNFANVSGTISAIHINGFKESRVATGTGTGNWGSDWTANAELTW